MKQMTRWILLAAFGLLLSACGGGPSNPVPTPNTVSVLVSPNGTITTSVKSSQAVSVTFNTNQNTASTLSITNLSSLPTAWSAAAFSGCTAVATSGSACKLNLTFAPTTVSNGTVTLNYTYRDNTNQARTGSVSIPYRVAYLNTGTNPSGSIDVLNGSARDVSINFSAAPFSTTDTNFEITGGLDDLPTGWSINSNDTLKTTNTFACTSITADNGCQLSLHFSPSSATESGTVTLPYRYVDSDGKTQTGSFTLPYAGSTTNNVLATVSPAAVISTAAGFSVPVNIAFTAEGGTTATNFAITSGLSSLSPNFTGPAAFTCDTVTSSNGCLLTLHYSPTATTQDGHLTLAYSYKDTNGDTKTGTAEVSYLLATAGTVIAQSSVASPVNVKVGGTLPLSIQFTSSNNQPMKNFVITSGLSALPTGWSSDAKTFSCSTIDLQNTCTLNVTYAPESENVAGSTLNVQYRYTDENGVTRTGNFSLTYTATLGNTVTATASPTSLAITENTSQNVTVNFVTGDGKNADNLSMPFTLPAGWSSTMTSPFTCDHVNTSGACTLTLTYAPTTYITASELSFPYTYTDSVGTEKSGTFTYDYSALLPGDNTVIGTASSAENVYVGSPETVTVDFTTSDTHTASTLAVTIPSLPATWAHASGSITCTTVPASPTEGCTLTFTYTPTAVESGSTITLNYTYTSQNGNPNGTGSVAIPYSSIAVPNAYFINNTTHQNIVTCPVNVSSDATTANFLSTCSASSNIIPTGRLNNAFMAWNTATNGAYAYVTSSSGSTGTTNTVFQCLNDSSTGLQNCTTFDNASGLPIAGISGLAFYKTNDGTTHAYLAVIKNAQGNPPAIYAATVDAATGTLGTPTDQSITFAAGTSFNGNTGSPSSNSGGMAVETINGTAYLYFTVYHPFSTSYIEHCLINSSTGGLSSCSNDTLNIVAADVSNPAVDTGCASIGTDILIPTGISFNTVNDSTFVYIMEGNHCANLTSVIFKCSVNASTGTVSGCTQTGYAGAAGSSFALVGITNTANGQDVKFETIGSHTYAVFTTFYTSIISTNGAYICGISTDESSLGDLINCTQDTDTNLAPANVMLSGLSFH